MKYSVLMPLYIKDNALDFSVSLLSMINQSYPPNEIVIVVDGPINSALDSELENFNKKYPYLIKIVKLKDNLGLGKALNIGLDKCKNELVARMDSDDYSKPMRCEKQINEFITDSSLTICGTFVDEFIGTMDSIIATRKTPLNHQEIYNYGKTRSPFNHPSVMYKKTHILSIGGYGEFRRNQDLDLFGRLLYNGYKAININESLVLYRVSKDVYKRRKSKENTLSYISIIKSFWKKGYTPLAKYITVYISQYLILLMPTCFTKYIYKKFLR